MRRERVPPRLRARTIATTTLWLLPPSRIKNSLLQRIGHHIAVDARLGMSLVLGCAHFDVGHGATVGHGNVFRDLRSVRVGDRCGIGQLNQFTATSFPFHDDPQAGTFAMDSEADVTNRHYFDCTGGIRLEHRSLIGGVRSIVRSYDFDADTNDWSSGTVVVGAFSMVGARSLVLTGCVIPPRSLVAAGAVVTPASVQDQTPGLYAGSPVSWKRGLPDCAWWHRQELSTMPASAGEVTFDNLLAAQISD